MLIVLSLSCQRKALRCDGLRKSPWCDKPQRRLYGGQRLSGQLVRWASRGACTAECLWWAVCQVEHCRLAHPAAKVAVSGVCVHQKAIWCPAKADAPPGCGEHCEQLRRRTRRRTDFPVGLPTGAVQKALFAALAFQYGGKRHPRGGRPSQTVN